MDTKTGEFTEKTLAHEGNKVREFYAALEVPVVVGKGPRVPESSLVGAYDQTLRQSESMVERT